MLKATLELARRVERFEIDFCAAGAGVGSAGGAASLEIGGGRAVCGAPGLPMNKVLALGLGVDVSDADLDELEDFYAERNVQPQIELCPLAVPGLAPRLNRRGFVLQGFENELARELGTDRIVEPPDSDVVATTPDIEEVWLRVVAEGFAAGENSSAPPPPEVTQAIGTIMAHFAHPDISRFLARIDGEPAGAASSYIDGGVVGIFGTSTLPSFRRRGAQHALVARMLNLALGHADLAVATTEPGSTSQRTFERFGFQVLYTRAIFVMA